MLSFPDEKRERQSPLSIVSGQQRSRQAPESTTDEDTLAVGYMTYS